MDNDQENCEFNSGHVSTSMAIEAYSRRVIGWALDEPDEGLTLAALRMALASWTLGPGMVHHSDRGTQYASNE